MKTAMSCISIVSVFTALQETKIELRVFDFFRHTEHVTYIRLTALAYYQKLKVKNEYFRKLHEAIFSYLDPQSK